MSERQGIEIDYCPSCRGIWLDRGELDKLIERSTALVGPPPVRKDDRDHARKDDRDHARKDDRDHARKDNHDHSYGTKHKGKHKRESFWGDLFDFD
jgi:Zn-finger nucleic acid-binding protein